MKTLNEQIIELLKDIKKELQDIKGILELNKFIPEDSSGIRDSRQSISIARPTTNL